MISLFETIIEALSVPLESWDKLGNIYRIILFTTVFISLVGIIIVLNY